MLLQMSGENTGLIVGIVGSFLGLVGIFFDKIWGKKLDLDAQKENKLIEKEIANQQGYTQQIDLLRQEMKEMEIHFLQIVKEREGAIEANRILISTLSEKVSVLKHIFKVILKQYESEFKDDPSKLVLLREAYLYLFDLSDNIKE